MKTEHFETHQNIKEQISYLSEFETAILRSTEPIDFEENEEISILGQRGIVINKSEINNWNGKIPIYEYPINEDLSPEIITKKSQRQVEYIQQLAIRYLKPPTPPTPGDIIITQEPDISVEPAPPIIIRQQPSRVLTPEPLIIREEPPAPPLTVNKKFIKISGRKLPPPPRKVVIERLAPLPSKPQGVIVERWLPYNESKRKVVFNRNKENAAKVLKPKNVIIEWQAPKVLVKKEVKYLGVIKANPIEYLQRYGDSLKKSNDLPQFVLDIETPDNICLAADMKHNLVHELEGQVEALKLVDLDLEGLSEYKSQLARLKTTLGERRRNSTESNSMPESGRGSSHDTIESY